MGFLFFGKKSSFNFSKSWKLSRENFKVQEMFQTFGNFVAGSIFQIQNEKIFAAVAFFAADFPKILFLIFAVVGAVSFFRQIFGGKLERFFARRLFGLQFLAAAIFGAITPFCSCSSIPIFLGFLKSGVPRGAAFAFLITSPLVNEVALILIAEKFSVFLAFFYAAAGILLGFLGGLFFEKFVKFAPENFPEKKICGCGCQKKSPEFLPRKNFAKIARAAFFDARQTLREIWPFVFAGIFLGAIFHGFVPADFLKNLIGKIGFLQVPAAVFLGIPIYAGCSAAVPIIFEIAANGVPLGTSLAFLMAIAGLSLPEFLILKKVLPVKILGIFGVFVAAGILAIGVAVNFLEKFF